MTAGIDDVAAPAAPSRGEQLGPLVVLGVLIAMYVAVFGTLTWKQQSNFATFGFDMGIYDQGVWLLSRFMEPFITVRGLNYFGHHVNLVTVLFVPFYWLGAGPHFLYAVQTVILAAGAIPVYLLARDATDKWIGLVPAAAFLLYPAVGWTNWWHFHPDALIITPLLFAWWLAQRNGGLWYWVALAFALAAKEDAALAVTVMGVVLALRGKRALGAKTAVAGLLWYLLCTQLLIPIANGGKTPFYDELYPAFGNSMTEILGNMILHPSRVWELAVHETRLEYYWDVLAPVGFLALLAPLLLLAAIPQLIANILSIHQPTHDVHYHYTAVLTTFVFIAVVHVFGRVARRGRWWTVGVSVYLLAAVSTAHYMDSPSPLSRAFGRDPIWATGPPSNAAAVRAALALVKPDDRVSASFYLVPQLSQREFIYEYPNPFRTANWGVNGEDPPDPESADTLVVDTGVTGSDTYLYDSLVSENGPFRIVFERGNIVVARRK